MAAAALSPRRLVRASLLVLTFVRDLALLVSGVLGIVGVETMLRAEGAIAVPALAALVTLAGFVNARVTARVKFVDVPVADLPAALHGFSIAQLSDLHVGPTIKRGYIARIVER